MAMGIWLPGGGGADLDAVTAGAGDVLAGKVILDSEGEPLTGTMPERGNWSSSELSAGASITIPGGHHSGSGKVTAKSLSAQTSGTATAAQILSGKTAWVNGSEVTGSMANRGNYGGAGNSRGNDTSGQRMWVKVPGGYYNENAQVFLNWADIRSMAGLTPDKIKKNVSIMGITGTHDGFVPGPMDIYNRGAWGAGYGASWYYRASSTRPGTASGYIANESSAIKIVHNNGTWPKGDTTVWCGIKVNNLINFTPYSKLNVIMRPFFNSRTSHDAGVYIIGTDENVITYNEAYFRDEYGLQPETSVTVDLTGVNVSGYIAILPLEISYPVYDNNPFPYIGYVNKIWFS